MKVLRASSHFNWSLLSFLTKASIDSLFFLRPSHTGADRLSIEIVSSLVSFFLFFGVFSSLSLPRGNFTCPGVFSPHGDCLHCPRLFPPVPNHLHLLNHVGSFSRHRLVCHLGFSLWPWRLRSDGPVALAPSHCCTLVKSRGLDSSPPVLNWQIHGDRPFFFLFGFYYSDQQVMSL